MRLNQNKAYPNKYLSYLLRTPIKLRSYSNLTFLHHIAIATEYGTKQLLLRYDQL